MSEQARVADGDVLCVTLNAALDVTYEVATVVPGDENRVEKAHTHAGGKGVNVARLLQAWDRNARVLAFAGGRVGVEIAASLDAAGVPHDLVPCEGDSRRTVTVVSATDNAATGFYESGPTISTSEWRAFLAAFEALVPTFRIVVLAGSLPPGVPEDAYRQLTHAGRDRGLAVIVDAHGKQLLHALDAGPSVVTPNEVELAEAVGLTPPVPVEVATSAPRRLVDGGAERAVVTLGRRGLVGVFGSQAWHATTPPVHGNPVGAGDAVVAVVADAALTRQPWPETLRRAAATAAAAVRAPIAGVVDPQHVADMLAHVETREL
jgi:tagatose 6-phosphate kinase